MILKYIEEKAETLLREKKLFKAGFDIFMLAEKLGITLKEENLSDDVSGFFIINDNKPIISYNSNSSPYRTRFTIAHEIGHFVLHSKAQPIFIDKAPKVFFRNTASSTGEILKEREANSFAAALLMPRELIYKEALNAPSNKDVEEVLSLLSSKFDVSTQAMSFRLSNLGFDIG